MDIFAQEHYKSSGQTVCVSLLLNISLLEWVIVL